MISIAELESYSRVELIEHYQTLLGHLPPKSLSRSVMVLMIKYESQALRDGPLPLKLRKQLRSIAEDNRTTTPNVRLNPDARLIREWNGVSHVVDRVEHGFSYRGTTYRSLSAIAKEITGAKWSGPRFFGLTRLP